MTDRKTPALGPQAASVELSALAPEARRCPYCGKPKRGWRKAEPDALCSDCERKTRQ